ncbi:MAG: type I-F CRISPR-associated helicase Cas3f [Methyloprofundus sp.]|nr:type I-F CRISPR-associated helicase Cas3f [Methyloprofundus sp.]
MSISIFASATGSESQDEFLDPDLFIDYSGSLQDHSLNEWTKSNSRLQKLLEAPVLTCTIDHLMPACEGTKGGKQIGPMLRLLTSDLVLDEPDDFGLEDLPALCRLVHWAAMLGSRVLLSTATMPPALTFALFQAYQAGWKEYAKANIQNYDGQIVCAWFNEFGSQEGQFHTFELFKDAHNKFVKNRVKALYEQVKKSKPQRLGDIVTVNCQSDIPIAANLAQNIQTSIIKLHQVHQQSHEGKTVSIGLVRMANINPLVAVARELLKHDAPENTCIHYCVYHSRFPLAIRSYIEEQLDTILARQDPHAIFKHENIKNILNAHPQQHHIFVVLASPVAEVGRDHDYDWAIIEPSSMRSIIQIAGRVLRHRNKTPEQANVLLLSKNYKALAGKALCYERPGFESKELTLAQHDLESILNSSQYQQINAVERIILPAQYNKTKDGKYMNLIELEHKSLALQLFGGNEPANIWWQSAPYWCGEVQRQQRFRNSKKDEAYYLWLTDEYGKSCWKWKNEQVYPPKFGEALIDIKTIHENEIELGSGSQFWFDLSAQTIYSKLAGDFNVDYKEVSMRFGEVRITQYNSNQQEYCYHPNFGIYQEIGY